LEIQEEYFTIPMVSTDSPCIDPLLHVKVLEGHSKMKISLSMLTVLLLLTEVESAAPGEAGYLAFPPFFIAFLLCITLALLSRCDL
jgi:hypothetical protein